MSKKKIIIGSLIIVGVIILVLSIVLPMYLSGDKKNNIKGNFIRWSNDGSLNNKCIGVLNGIKNGGSNGTPIIASDCPDLSSPSLPNFYFKNIKNQLVWSNNGSIPNKCISVSGGFQNGGSVNTPFVIWDCPNNTSTDPNLQFKFYGNQIVWLNNGNFPFKCMSISNGIQNGGKNESDVKLWDCQDNTSNDPNLQFKYI
jgi:hypothetical protein